MGDDIFYDDEAMLKMPLKLQKRMMLQTGKGEKK